MLPTPFSRKRASLHCAAAAGRKVVETPFGRFPQALVFRTGIGSITPSLGTWHLEFVREFDAVSLTQQAISQYGSRYDVDSEYNGLFSTSILPVTGHLVPFH
jgi:hypothetical protein